MGWHVGAPSTHVAMTSAHCPTPRVREHLVITVQLLLDELHDVLTRKFHQREPDVRSTLRLFRETFTLVTPDALQPASVS